MRCVNVVHIEAKMDPTGGDSSFIHEMVALPANILTDFVSVRRRFIQVSNDIH